jgi:hypothetical protein
MPKSTSHPSPSRRVARRLSPVLLVVAMVTAVLVFAAPPAQAAAKWNSGSTKYTTITNCPSIIWGNPYQEYGIGAFVSYWGDQTSDPVTPAVGETTYLDTFAMRVGSHCSTPIIYPRFVLPGGVEFDKTQAIKCYYTPPGQAQRQVTHAGECPQWQNISANGYYSNSVSGWGGGWPLPSNNGDNGSAWEFLVPVKATSQVWGAQLTTELGVADGNAGPTLNLTVPLYTAAPAVTAPGAPTNVAANATSPTSAQVSFNPPANDGGSAITSYRAQCTSPNGGTSRTVDGAASPITFTNLSPGKDYRCHVKATNPTGTSSYSTYSSTVTLPATRPDRPTNVRATASTRTSAKVTFAAPASNGGAAITSYRVQCASSNGGTTRSADGTASPIKATRLTPGKAYRCRVKARNAAGDSAYSAYSTSFRLPA